MTQLALFDVAAAPPSSGPEVGFLYARPVLYASPIMLIGRHEWALVIYDTEHYGTGQDYVWRRADAVGVDAVWQRGRQWPTYDGNHQDAGMPRSLRRLWEREEPARVAHGLGRH